MNIQNLQTSISRSSSNVCIETMPGEALEQELDKNKSDVPSIKKD